MRRTMFAMFATLVGAASAQMTWTRVLDSAPWSARFQHAAVAFHDSIWVMGGWLGGTSVENDVWCSADGVDWTAKPDAQWSPRLAHASVVKDDQVWVLGGGLSYPFLYNDVWRTTDGDSWIEVTASAGWRPRWAHASVAYHGRLWVMGGRYAQPPVWLTDVWSSVDGDSWVLEADTTEWATRGFHASVVFDDKMWVMGGRVAGFQTSGVDTNDVWWSTDGRSWTCATPAAGWSPRLGHQAVVLNDTIWLAGGLGQTGSVLLKDVWYSTDGASWTQADTAEWSRRALHTAVAMDDRIWVLGGLLDTNYTTMANDVWSSTGLGIAEAPGSAFRRPDRPVVACGVLMLPAGGAALLLDIVGRRVMDLQSGENDVRHLAPGVYLVCPALGIERRASAVHKVIVTR